jgi:hypothetical protein
MATSARLAFTPGAERSWATPKLPRPDSRTLPRTAVWSGAPPATGASQVTMAALLGATASRLDPATAMRGPESSRGSCQ